VCACVRLERLDYLAQKFKSKCDNHEQWASGKDDMLRNKDYKNCRLNELKVLSTVSTGYCKYWLLMSTGCCEYWVVGSSLSELSGQVARTTC